ncbi:MAG: DUF2442 domain-containing protein [Candidatus Omnitrophica bacterium]|nr:DUF2442 domain-containing protein [Candidatus Omnitrophota bacterium]
MKSLARGKSTSKAEVQNISENGVWLYVSGKEFFLPYEQYPWFKNATVSQICRLRFLRGGHLHWPDLDVDLELESLEHPERYPLVYRGRDK